MVLVEILAQIKCPLPTVCPGGEKLKLLFLFKKIIFHENVSFFFVFYCYSFKCLAICFRARPHYFCNAYNLASILQ